MSLSASETATLSKILSTTIQIAFAGALLLSLISIPLSAKTLLAAKGHATRPSIGGSGGSAGTIYPQFKLNGRNCRWIREQMPFKVWVAHGLSFDNMVDATGAPVAHTANTAQWPDAVIALLSKPEQLETMPIAQLYNEQQFQAALQGFNSWKSFEKEALFSYEFVDKPEDADVYVFWTNHFVNKMGLALFENDIRGLTSRYVLPVREVMAAIAQNNLELVQRSRKPVVILLRTAEADGSPINPLKMRAAAAHEFGHALGIDGHSPYPGDLMSVYYGRGTISANDAATIRYLYRSPADLMP